MQGMNNINFAVSCDVLLGRTDYQQRDVWDNDPVCMCVSRGYFRLRLYPTFRDVSHGVVGVERHVCILQNLPEKFKRFSLRPPEIQRRHLTDKSNGFKLHVYQ
jgi:hypothetical protein